MERRVYYQGRPTYDSLYLLLCGYLALRHRDAEGLIFYRCGFFFLSFFFFFNA